VPRMMGPAEEDGGVVGVGRVGPSSATASGRCGDAGSRICAAGRAGPGGVRVAGGPAGAPRRAGRLVAPAPPVPPSSTAGGDDAVEVHRFRPPCRAPRRLRLDGRPGLRLPPGRHHRRPARPPPRRCARPPPCGGRRGPADPDDPRGRRWPPRSPAAARPGPWPAGWPPRSSAAAAHVRRAASLRGGWA
jgi:hypothetical protein